MNLKSLVGRPDDDIVAKETPTEAKFKKIAVLPDEEKNLVLKMITAYIRDFNTQQAYAS